MPHTRSFAQRFSRYLSVIVIGPVLIFSSIGFTESLAQAGFVTALAGIEPFATIFAILRALVPFALTVAAFAFVYTFIPNTRVRAASALVGGLGAAVLWGAAGWAFTSFVVTSAKFTAIYSAFAALIVFMIWLYVAWLILLSGAAIAYYHQHPENLTERPGTPRFSRRTRLRAELAAAAIIVAAWRRADPPPTSETLAQRLRIPGVLAESVALSLERIGLIIPAGEHGDAQGWVPARPPEDVTLAWLLETLQDEGDEVRPGGAARIADGALERVEAASREALGALTVDDLAQDRLRNREAATRPEVHRLEPPERREEEPAE